MKVILYQNTAESSRLDKSSFLELMGEFEGFLRESSSLLNPTITFEMPNEGLSLVIDEDDEEIATPDSDVVVDSDVFMRFNYAYIPDFQRYYYVTDIQIIRSHLFRVSFAVDVLMSFKDYLLSLSGFIERNEFSYDDDLSDSLKPFEEKASVTIEQAESGNIQFSVDAEWLDYNFVVNMLVCNANFKGGAIEKPFSIGDMMDPETFQAGNSIPYAITNNKVAQVLYRAVKGQDGDKVEPFINSVVAFPFNIPLRDNATLQKVWYEDSTKILKTQAGLDLEGYIPKANTSDYLIAGYVNVPPVSSFADLPPYRRIEVYMPFYGWHELDLMKTSGHRLAVYYVANYIDGSAMVYLHDVTTATLIFSSSCQLGNKIPVTKTNLQEIEVSKNALNSQLAINLVSSALNIGIGSFSGNPFSIAKGISNIGSSFANYVNSNASLFHHASVSFGGGAMGLYSPLRVQIRTTRFNTSIDDEGAYAKLYGKPLYQTRLLSTLSGFTTIPQIHLEDLPAFSSEREDIARLLKDGVIL